MSSILPINIEDILQFRGVESVRVEFKASWDERATAQQVLKTICAFANDLQNLNGGYIIVGVAEKAHKAELPPKGLTTEQLDHSQKWIRGNCNRIDPPFQPILSPEEFQGKNILVIWAPGSDVRPHRAPDGENSVKKYWVRLGSETVDAEKNGVLNQLIQLTARVPFDSRRALSSRLEDLRESKVREFLHDINSSLVDEPDTTEIYRRMRIIARANSHEVPLNIGLLFFSDDPEKWFLGARIEVVHFADEVSGNIQTERVFKGPLHEQVRDCLAYLQNLSSSHFQKNPSEFRVRGWASYPLPALREAVVNAVYHRGYAESIEPTKIYLHSDRIEIISYPGPVPGIRLDDLLPGASARPVPARNRRIGELLKELRLAEGRHTGLPKMYRAMEENGSPQPRIDFDEGLTYFRIILPAHPEYIAITALRDAAHLTALGDSKGALLRIQDAWNTLQSSPTLTAEYIRLLGRNGNIGEAERAFEAFKNSSPHPLALPHVMNTLINVYFENRRHDDARQLFKQMPDALLGTEAVDAAILARRIGNEKKAHGYFVQAGDAVLTDARAAHEFAQAKMAIAGNVFKEKRPGWKDTRQRLLTEALQLLERVLQMEAPPERRAWAWRDVGRVRAWLKAPRRDIQSAFEKALSILPAEPIFQNDLQRFCPQDPKRMK